MRKIYNTSQAKLSPINTFRLTEEQYNSILSNLKQLSDISSAESSERAAADKAITERINSILQTADIDTATIDNLTAEIANIATGTITDLTADRLTVELDARLKSANIEVLRAPTIISSDITADSVTAADGKFTTVTADTLHVTDYSADSENIGNLTASSATIDTENVTDSVIQTAEIDTATIQTAEVTDLTADNSAIESLKSRNIFNEFTLHSEKFNRQFISDDSVGADGDYWIVLPKFVNGEYDLIATTNTDAAEGEALWSMEIVNSTRNICFKWSTNKARPWIEDVEIVEDATDNKSFIQIHCKTYSQATYLWHKCDSLDTQAAPQIYSTKQYEGKGFAINRDAGMYLNNTTFAGEFHADKLLIDSVEFESVYILKNLFLTTQYDQYGASLGTTRGTAGQYVTNTEDEYGNEGLQWVSPLEKVQYDSKKKLITADAVAKYDGSVQSGTDADGNPTYDYNITELGDASTVHGSLTIKDTLTTEKAAVLPNFYNGTEADLPADLPVNSIVIFTEVNDNSDYVTNIIYRKDTTGLTEIISTKSLSDQKPVIYNQEDNTLTTSDKLSIDTLDADTIVVDELYVNGTAHIDSQEEDTVVGDFLTLRANNNSPLTTGQYSGLLVNNFQTDKLCAIVVDNNGTARVGWATGSSTEYPDLYYHDNHYYTDAELTQEVTPEGVMLSWADYESTDEYEHWTDAVWKVLEFTDTQPLLTRAEEADLNDQGILKYNTDTHRADTLPLPTKSEQFLSATVTEGTPEETDYAASINGVTLDAELSPIDISDYEVKPITAEFEYSGHYYELDSHYYFYDCDQDTFYWHELTGLNMANLTVTAEEVTVQRILDELRGHENDGNLVLLRVEYVTAPASPATVSYSWKDKQAGNYHFNTVAEYQEAADLIPEGSLVMIDEETTYVIGDDQ